MAAQSVKQSDCVFGVMYRRLRARLGTCPSDRRHGARHRAGGVPDVEVQGGVRDDQRGRVREEVRGTASQVREEEGRQTRLPTHATRSSLRATGWDEKRRPHAENACFAFNRTRRIDCFLGFRPEFARISLQKRSSVAF